MNSPAEQEHENGGCQVESDHVHPDVYAEGFKEREEVGRRGRFLLVEDPHSRVHEGHGEIHCLLSCRRDGHVNAGKVGFP